MHACRRGRPPVRGIQARNCQAFCRPCRHALRSGGVRRLQQPRSQGEQPARSAPQLSKALLRGRQQRPGLRPAAA